MNVTCACVREGGVKRTCYHAWTKWVSSLFSLFPTNSHLPPSPKTHFYSSSFISIFLFDLPHSSLHFSLFLVLSSYPLVLFFFVFAWTYFIILLIEYEFMIRETQNFMERNKTWKVVGRYWACCKFVWVHILFLTLIWFSFL